MKNFVYYLSHIFVAIILVLSSGCTSTPDARVVSVTILPQKYFAEQIAGDRFVVNCVVPAGSNPESFDPSPSSLVCLDKSEAYFRVGDLGFEMAWMDKLAQNNPSMKIYNTSEGVNLLTGTHVHEHNGTEHRVTAVDPHVWCSPKSAYIMARNMYDAFVELDPKGREYYKSNYDTLVQRITEVDSLLTELLLPLEGTTFAIYHPSLSYLARDYGLLQLCLENEGKESSALYLKGVIDVARTCDVNVVFVQKEFNSRQVITFASEIDADIVTINPLNYNWDEEMINIAHAIARR